MEKEEENDPVVILVGEILRKKREELGISLEEIAEVTKIQIAYLEDIENNVFTALPGEVFCRGFIKAMAVYLGLDPEEMRVYYEKNQSDVGKGSRSDIRRGSGKVDNSDFRKGISSFKANWSAEDHYLSNIVRIGGVFLVIIVVVFAGRAIVQKVNYISGKQEGASTEKGVIKDALSKNDSDRTRTGKQIEPGLDKVEIDTSIKSVKGKEVVKRAGSSNTELVNDASSSAEGNPAIVEEKSTNLLSEQAEGQRGENKRDSPASSSIQRNTELATVNSMSSLLVETLQEVKLTAIIDNQLIKKDNFPPGTRFKWEFTDKAQLILDDISRIRIIYNEVEVPMHESWRPNQNLTFYNQSLPLR